MAEPDTFTRVLSPAPVARLFQSVRRAANLGGGPRGRGHLQVGPPKTFSPGREADQRDPERKKGRHRLERKLFDVSATTAKADAATATTVDVCAPTAKDAGEALRESKAATVRFDV